MTNLIRKHRSKLVIVHAIAVLPLLLSVPAADDDAQYEKKWKILHVMSYHSPWRWTDEQFNGFKLALDGLDVEYNVYQMNTKNFSTKDALRRAGESARSLIAEWQPDLVYVSDDNALVQIGPHYAGSKLPIVFSGVNAHPDSYPFLKHDNFAGVLEQEHAIESIHLLKQIVPRIKKIAIIIDGEGSTWDGVMNRFRSRLNQAPDVEIIFCKPIASYEEYQRKILELHNEVDAIGLIGIFTFKDHEGNNVHYTEVLRWTADNSKLPDYSYWIDRVDYGTLCTVTVSGYEQGFAAGNLARKILLDGVTPRSLPLKPSIKGEPVISLARANRLGIKVKAKILLTAQIVKNFKWETE